MDGTLCGVISRQLDHPQVIRPIGEVAGGKGCSPAANDLVENGQSEGSVRNSWPSLCAFYRCTLVGLA